MSKILIIYSSVHGQTRKLCEFMQRELEALEHSVTCASIDNPPALEGFDKIVLGASIRHGKHNPRVYDFIRENIKVLQEKASTFFSVSLVARKPAKNTPETNPYMQAFLAKSPWQPKLLAVFGGNLDYQGYNALDRNIIRFIMWITKGPTAPDTKVEYTDWDKVKHYARQVAAL
ncbi:menaquinone-dependent protoporphyrinogen IX dehydrogenase [Shewanella insulae]|uniref:menaquinone-dependent protoporphyrinogen IX dehydrogenase n=1 Tax=Shewanella insulae TaxID=2681496 RepID=UPI001EFD96C3|nr:menaquinone-dependent protoporphyrinogen IX dehydrogenase [Shewanella insulae]